MKPCGREPSLSAQADQPDSCFGTDQRSEHSDESASHNLPVDISGWQEAQLDRSLKDLKKLTKDKLYLFTLTSRCAEKGAKGQGFHQPILALSPST